MPKYVFNQVGWEPNQMHSPGWWMATRKGGKQLTPPPTYNPSSCLTNLALPISWLLQTHLLSLKFPTPIYILNHATILDIISSTTMNDTFALLMNKKLT